MIQCKNVMKKYGIDAWIAPTNDFLVLNILENISKSENTLPVLQEALALWQ